MPLKDPVKRAAYRKKYREEHAEEIRQRKIAYRAKNLERLKEKDRRRYLANSGKIKNQVKTYFKEHKAHLTAVRKERHEKNPGQVKAWLKQWYANNRARRYALNAKRRAIKAAAQVGDRKSYAAFVLAIRNASRMACYWCSCIVPKGERHVDHIVALSKGGADDVHNLCCACESCNLSKGNKLPEEFSGQFVLPF